MTPFRTFVPLIVAALLCSVDSVSAEVVGARASDPALQAAIEARQEAIDRRNADGLSRYTADDFVQVGSDGSVRTRKERMAALVSNTAKPNRLPVTIDNVRMFGSDAAVTIQHRGASRISMFWVRQNGAWKVVSTFTTMTGK